MGGEMFIQLKKQKRNLHFSTQSLKTNILADHTSWQIRHVVLQKFCLWADLVESRLYHWHANTNYSPQWPPGLRQVSTQTDASGQAAARRIIPHYPSDSTGAGSWTTECGAIKVSADKFPPCMWDKKPEWARRKLQVQLWAAPLARGLIYFITICMTLEGIFHYSPGKIKERHQAYITFSSFILMHLCLLLVLTIKADRYCKWSSIHKYSRGLLHGSPLHIMVKLLRVCEPLFQHGCGVVSVVIRGRPEETESRWLK